MLKLKETKAITLIALIVTIVVLLILAGVTIANVTGGDGIIEQASEQRDKTKISAEEQILGNAVISASDKFGEITENNLRQSLSNQNVEITKSGGLYRIVFKDTNNLYKMNHDGEYFYWEDMQPTDIYAKKDGTTLYLRSSQPDTSYVKGEKWNDATITKIVIEEPIAPRNGLNLFQNCSKLEEIQNIENLHTENMYSMQSMFDGCTKLKDIDVHFFDTSKSTSMYLMFSSCKALKNLDLRNFDTSKVTTMYGMFTQCENLKNIKIDSFNTPKLNNMAYMFNHCFKLENINLISFDTSLVTQMQYLFNCCYAINKLDLSSFNTSLVNNTTNMFCSNNKLQIIYVSNLWSSNKINSSNYMFAGCKNLIGGNGTKYNFDYNDKTYARIDAPETPGYFTLKEH